MFWVDLIDISAKKKSLVEELLPNTVAPVGVT